MTSPFATLKIRVQPRARRDEIVTVRDGVLVVRVSAPALEGRANRAVCRLLADRFGVPGSSVTLVRGERARDKVVRIDGIDQAVVDALLS